MAKRSLLSGIVFLTLVVTAVVFFCRTSSNPGLSQKNIERIRIGMTEEQVEAILGPSTDIVRLSDSYSRSWNKGQMNIWVNFSVRMVDAKRGKLEFAIKATGGSWSNGDNVDHPIGPEGQRDISFWDKVSGFFGL